MEQQQDQYDILFSDAIDWASIPLPDARPNEVVVNRTEHSDGNGNTTAILEDSAIESPENITMNGTIPQIGGGTVGLSGITGMGGTSVGVSGGMNSNSTKDCVAQCIRSGNSTRSLDGRTEQPEFSSEIVEELKKKLAQKDAALFDLESTIVALEAESSSRIQKSENDSAIKVQAAQDELRRMRQDLDSKTLALVKSKKRRKEEERHQQQNQNQGWQHNDNAENGVIPSEKDMQSNASRWRNPSKRHTQPQSVEMETTPTSATNLPSTPMSISENKNAMLRGMGPSASQNSYRTKSTAMGTRSVGTRQLAAHLLLLCNNFNTSIMSTLPKTKDQDILKEWNEYKEDEYRIRTMLESISLASSFSMQAIATTADMESEYKADMNDTYKTSQVLGLEHFARELICMFVAKFPSHPVATSGTVVETIDGKENNTDNTISHTVLPINDGGDSAKQCTSKAVPPQSHNNRSAAFWLSVEWILSMLHEACSNNAELCSNVLFWICQSCSNSNPSGVQLIHNKTNDSASASFKNKKKNKSEGNNRTLSFTNTHRVLSRIRGISSKQSKSQIVHATLNMMEILGTEMCINEEGETLDSLYNHRSSIWDAQHRGMVCEAFIKILSSLIIGKNKSQWESLPSSGERHKIPPYVQMKSIALFHIWLNGYPGDNEDGLFPPLHCFNQELDIIILCTNYLLLPWSAKTYSSIYECDNSEKNETSNFHWTDLISLIEIQFIIPGMQSVGRRQYLQWTEGETNRISEEDRGEKGESCNNIMQIETNQSIIMDRNSLDQQHTCNNSHIPLVNESSDISTKCSAIQLLEKLVRSSSRVRNLLFDNMLYCKIPNFRTGVTGERRIVASILDDLQGFIIPSISKYSNLLCINGCNNDERSQMEAVLFLCLNETRLVALMCESISGFALMRTLMKVRSVEEEDSNMIVEIGDSEAGVAIMINVLECSVRVIIQNSCDVEWGKSEISYLWNAIVNNTLSFLHLFLRHVQECELNRQDKAKHISFASIISEVNRIDVLHSSLTMIADSEVTAGYCCFEEGVLHQARLLLHELTEMD